MQRLRVVVTGVSRGLGKDVLKLIAKNNPEYYVIGTVRGHEDELQKQLDDEFPNNSIKIQVVDIANSQSISKFVERLKQKEMRIDCLINNAAIGADYGTQVPSVELAKSTFATNVRGTIQLTQKLMPLLAQNGRIINVSSRMGGLVYQGKTVSDKFSRQDITLQQIKQEIESYIAGCAKGSVGDYCKSVYGTSKMMVNAWSRFILKKQLKNDQIAIAMSPGHCQTDMGKQHAPRSSIEGATSIYSHITGKRSFDIFYHIDRQSNYHTCG